MLKKVIRWRKTIVAICSVGLILVLVTKIWHMIRQPTVSLTLDAANHLPVESHVIEEPPPPPTFRQEQTYIVPNVVHYIWYSDHPRLLKFHQMLGILSAYKFIQPDKIIFHTNSEPYGKWWQKIIHLPSFEIKYREPPQSLFGEHVKGPYFYTSHSNVDRVKILYEEGGIYLDTDVFVVQPFEDLRNYPVTIGLETPRHACGSVILGTKGSCFLRMWLNSYLDDYRIKTWAYNSGTVPTKLAIRYPSLVHVEETRFNRPNFNELKKIYNGHFDWQRNYAVHTWFRLFQRMHRFEIEGYPDPQSIKKLNNSFGEMARVIYYGTADIIH